jgi:putative endonuclease
MAAKHTKDLGRLGERLAAEHFSRLGYDVLARNHHTRFGELDLVLSDGETLVFCEVKTRRLGSGDPWDNLHEAKRSQVRRMAAVGVIVDAAGELVTLDHLEGAF